MLALLAGVAAGAVHVLSGPDHLAAIAPLAGDERRRGWRSGLHWGMGHAAGVIAVGALALLARDILPIDFMSAWSERLVGIVLIGIGLRALRTTLARRVHVHEHEHDGARHVHVHVHAADRAHDPRARRPAGSRARPACHRHDHRHGAFAIGGLHGLAGSSHLLGVLPALAFPSLAGAIAYVTGFAVGSVVGMMLFAGLLGWTAGRMEAAGGHAYRALMGTCGAAAILIGGWWLLG